MAVRRRGNEGDCPQTMSAGSHRARFSAPGGLIRIFVGGQWAVHDTIGTVEIYRANSGSR